MDFMTVVIFLAIILSTLLMIVGPLLELKGKIFFLENKHPLKTRGRYGMGIMAVGALLFVGGCVGRSWLTSSVVTPLVLGGYAVWFAGGFISVIRNEGIKALEGGGEE
ncbi:MAG: hypothetical protein HFI33_12055 [Lachnospiraceae bacterium]|nr:hypothetical protein [Lachnospiraceae bacterium]